MDRSTIFHGKTHYFNSHFQQQTIRHYQRVTEFNDEIESVDMGVYPKIDGL